ncbi:ATP-grasp domain-containing protein [Phosphitispora fastidiosa]|uniref:ATP-grasp domain-containing protein n=1 Tax=Phosphitispora fastidiosa TaxID=2837202 RepID=UPI001E4186A6|nr:ATP-grasp domain-containing protein [Phosphitispora fastidiosa]MBU7005331.1 phosphoribosylamine-glycine ligase [Phosphitispora fastidiosa]
MKGKVLVLGGGLLQVPLLKMARDKGYEVHLSDYYKNPPGRVLADNFFRASTFSLEENLKYAEEMGINCVMTLGTDQPVYTAAFVSEKLGLPHPITADQGLSVTNKQYMKKIMTGSGIPSPNFRVLREKGDHSSVGLKYPVVLKPVDSQGQRGVFLLNGREDTDTIDRYFEESMGYSRTGKVILEEYYKGAEITVNCWVKGGRAYPLMITDRLHFDDSVALGICKQQRFPARGAAGYDQEIDRIINKLADTFKIREGPLYVQAVAGSAGIKIIEFGYRIGGGFESEIIPRVTGIDILDLYFTLVAEGRNTFEPELAARKAAMGSIFFMLARPGVITRIIVPEEFAGCGRLFVNSGDVIGTVKNATSRVGCFAFYTDSQLEYNNMLDRFDSQMAILDENNTDILMHGIWE